MLLDQDFKPHSIELEVSGGLYRDVNGGTQWLPCIEYPTCARNYIKHSHGFFSFNLYNNL